MHCSWERQQGHQLEGETSDIVHHEDFKSTDGKPEDIYALPRWFYDHRGGTV